MISIATTRSEKLFPWLSEMEQSVGWSRLVCSWQWRVKEITLGLCQQPWPCSHKNIMRKDMLGLQGREKKKKRLKFEAFITDSYGRQTAFCMLFYELGSMSKTVTFHRADWDGCLVWTYHFLASLSTIWKTLITARVETRMQRFPLEVLRIDLQHSTGAFLKIDATVLWVVFFGEIWVTVSPPNDWMQALSLPQMGPQ